MPSLAPACGNAFAFDVFCPFSCFPRNVRKKWNVLYNIEGAHAVVINSSHLTLVGHKSSKNSRAAHRKVPTVKEGKTMAVTRTGRPFYPQLFNPFSSAVVAADPGNALPSCKEKG